MLELEFTLINGKTTKIFQSREFLQIILKIIRLFFLTDLESSLQDSEIRELLDFKIIYSSWVYNEIQCTFALLSQVLQESTCFTFY